MKLIPLKSPDSPESEYLNFIDLGPKKVFRRNIFSAKKISYEKKKKKIPEKKINPIFMKLVPLKSPDSPESEYLNYIDLGPKKVFRIKILHEKKTLELLKFLDLGFMEFTNLFANIMQRFRR